MLNTPEFVSTNDVVWKNVLNLQFKQIVKNKKHLLARCSNLINLDLNRKILLLKTQSFGNYFNPAVSDNIVASNIYFRNSYSFNKENPGWGIDYDFSLIANKNLLSNGIEGRNVKKHNISLRTQPNSWLGIKFIAENSKTVATHEFFIDRNYNFTSNGGGTKISFMHMSILRLDLNYNYKFQSNAGRQFNVSHEAGIQTRFSKNEKGMIEGKISFLEINYVDNVKNEQVEFAMLSGLSRGGNFIWDFSVERKLTDVLNLTFVYQGRKNLILPNFVHSLTAEIRAFF